jgi:hypothetical protein
MREKKVQPAKTSETPSPTCIIPFGSYYILSEEKLAEYAPLKYNNKQWRGSETKFVAFKGSTLIIEQTRDKEKVISAFTVSEKALGINCSCGTASEGRLCYHNYYFLRKTINKSTGYFSQYRKDNIVELAANHEKHFKFEWEFNSLNVRTKTLPGTLFLPSGYIGLTFNESVIPYPAERDPAFLNPPTTGLCYLICLLPHKNILPVVVPCLGILNKAGTGVKGFQKFLSGTGKESAHLLTPDQLHINQVCLRLLKLAESMPGSFIRLENHDLKKLNEYLSLWQQLYPLLQQQPLVYRYRLWRLRNLKGKPELHQSVKIKLASTFPPISFVLEEKQDYYTFHASFPKPAPEKHFLDIWLFPFFFELNRELYFFPSIKDAALVEWLISHSGTITIFKEHFPKFEKEVLNHLKAYYNVKKVKKK